MRILALLLLALSVFTSQAATVTGSLRNILGVATDKTLVFSPLDAPFATGIYTITPTPTSVASSSGVFTVDLNQGSYRVSIDGQSIGFIRVPSGSASYNINALWATFTYLQDGGNLEDWSAISTNDMVSTSSLTTTLTRKQSRYATLALALAGTHSDGDVIYIESRTGVSVDSEFAGEFRYVAASTTSTNLGTIFAYSIGRLLRQYSGSLNPMWFGASTTAVDNSAAIQACLNHARSNGCVVAFPDAVVFPMTNRLTWLHVASNPTPQQLILRGNGAMLDWSSSPLTTGDLFVVGGTTSSDIAEQGLIDIANLRMLGPESTSPLWTTTSETTVAGLHIKHALNVTVSDVFVRLCYKGIHIENSQPINWRKVIARDCFVGWHFDDWAIDQTLLGCEAHQCGYGYLLRPTDTSKVLENLHFITPRSETCWVGFHVDQRDGSGNGVKSVTIDNPYFAQITYDTLRLGLAWDFATPQTRGADCTRYIINTELTGGKWSGTWASTNQPIVFSSNNRVRGGKFTAPVSYTNMVNAATTLDLWIMPMVDQATPVQSHLYAPAGANVIVPSGKGGFGTGDPEAVAHVMQNSDAGETFLRIEDSDTTAGSRVPRIDFFGGGSRIAALVAHDTSGLLFRSSADATVMTLDNSGNLSATSFSGAHSAPGSAADVPFNSAGNLAADTGNFGWNNSTKMLTARNLSVSTNAAFGHGDPEAVIHIKQNSDVGETFLRIEDSDTDAASRSPRIDFFGNGSRTAAIIGHDTLGMLFRNAADATVLALDTGGDLELPAEMSIGGGDPEAKLHIKQNSDVSEAFLIIEDLDTDAGSKVPRIDFWGAGARIGALMYSDNQGFLFRDASDATTASISPAGNAAFSDLDVQGAATINSGTITNAEIGSIQNAAADETWTFDGGTEGKTDTTVLKRQDFDSNFASLSTSVSNSNFGLSRSGIVLTNSDTAAASLTINGPSGGTNDLISANSGNTNRFKVTEAGNVGVGLTSPNSYAGYTTVQAQNTSGATYQMSESQTQGGQFLYDANGVAFGMITGSTAKPMRFKAGSFSGPTDAHVTLATSGNLGIGTTAPAERLHVSNGTNAVAIRADLSYTDPSNFESGIFSGQHKPGTLWIGSTNAGTGVAKPVDIGVGGVTAITVATNGNVGVGPSTPLAKLHVTSSDSSAVIRISNSAVDQYAGIDVHSNTGTLVGTAGTFSNPSATFLPDSFWIGSRSAGGKKFHLITSDAARLTIDTAGNVGIGTTAPAAKLHVSNGTNASSVFIDGTYTDASNYRVLESTMSTAGAAVISAKGLGTGATGNTLTFGTDGTNRWQISAAGHLLAGTDNAWDFGASGTNRARNVFTGGYAIFGGNVEIPSSAGYRIIAKGYLLGTSDGVFTFYNDGLADFSRLQFGGTSASFPSLKRSGTGLQVRLADDSGDAPLSANDLTLGKSITTVGTTGDIEINKASGRVNFAAAAQSLVVTNSLVTTNSIIIATVATDDTTALSCKAIPATGTFTLKLNAAATAETAVNWLVTN